MVRKVIRPWPASWLRAELEAELMHPLTNSQWTYLVEHTDHIRDAQAGLVSYAASAAPASALLPFGSGRPVNLHALADRVRAELASLGVKAPRPARPPEVAIPRARAYMDALSRIVASRVSKRDDVRRIRSTKLSGKRAIEEADTLAMSLAAETGWTQREARLFLTGGAIRLLPVSEIPRGGRYITLSVDPMVSPSELARAYAEMRRSAVGIRRLRRLTAKHMELAVFMEEQAEGGAPQWNKRMAGWNARAPRKWRYRAVTNFARDCVAAQRRMEAPE